MTRLNTRLLDKVMGLTPSEKPICECGHRDYSHAEERIGRCTYWKDGGTQCDCALFRLAAAAESKEAL